MMEYQENSCPYTIILTYFFIDFTANLFATFRKTNCGITSDIFSKKSENGTWCCKALGLQGDPYGALIEFGKNSGII